MSQYIAAAPGWWSIYGIDNVTSIEAVIAWSVESDQEVSALVGPVGIEDDPAAIRLSGPADEVFLGFVYEPEGPEQALNDYARRAIDRAARVEGLNRAIESARSTNGSTS